MLLVAVIAALATPCVAPQDPAPQTTPRTGVWRAWLDCPGGEIPFGLELAPGTATGTWKGWLLNGPERVAIGAVAWKEGELVLHFAPYDSAVRAHVSKDGKRLDGEWIRYRAPGRETRMTFHADHGEALRFAIEARYISPAAFPSGRCRVQFSEDDHHSVGIFELQPKSTVLHATFLTTLGDYRFLAGVFDGSNLSLSCFDGAHAFLFKAVLQTDGTLAGDFWSRDAWHETWTAKPDPGVTMPDAFGLTRFVGGVPLDKLVFRGTDGVERSLADERFAGKARLVVLFGTWCPNCNDETDYLVELHRRYKDRGLSILGLAFEFGDDFERNARVVREYAEFHGAEFPMLVAGTSDKKEASKAFPVLDKVRAYPTTLFMTPKGQVRAVYTGFSGPATGKAHERLRDAFEARIEDLLSESD
ncbi:MAG: TlpA family protein disulfide reductase [bacterium]|nr:TlpA family protein disulfide reductase [bacterium]